MCDVFLCVCVCWMEKCGRSVVVGLLVSCGHDVMTRGDGSIHILPSGQDLCDE